MGLFGKALLKIAEEMFDSSMSDKWKEDSHDYTPVEANTETPTADQGKFRQMYRTLYKEDKELPPIDKPRPKFFTSEPNENIPEVVSKEDFDYKNFSNNTPFKDISSFIASEEGFDGKDWHTISQLKGDSGGNAYGHFQIYEDHFVPGARWYDTKYDKHFKKASDIYNANPTKFGSKTGEPLDYMNASHRKKLMKLSYPEFNSIDSDSLSYNIARDIYNTQGLDAWDLRSDIVASYKIGTPRHLRK